GYDDFEVAALPCTGRRLDDAAGSGHIVVFTRDSLPADPRQTGVAVVTVEVAQFHGAGGLPQGYDDFEVAALPCTGRRLVDAAGSGHIVVFTRDSLPADPR
ncbi:MAG: hypothetical protein M3143_09860, partial [Actinomycetota bacterium]|nr:hypothetical protein [Actinomycetota bacterium]